MEGGESSTCDLPDAIDRSEINHRYIPRRTGLFRFFSRRYPRVSTSPSKLFRTRTAGSMDRDHPLTRRTGSPSNLDPPTRRFDPSAGRDYAIARASRLPRIGSAPTTLICARSTKGTLGTSRRCAHEWSKVGNIETSHFDAERIRRDRRIASTISSVHLPHARRRQHGSRSLRGFRMGVRERRSRRSRQKGFLYAGTEKCVYVRTTTAITVSPFN